jgi:hypothetical protein
MFYTTFIVAYKNYPLAGGGTCIGTIRQRTPGLVVTILSAVLTYLRDHGQLEQNVARVFDAQRFIRPIGLIHLNQVLAMRQDPRRP